MHEGTQIYILGNTTLGTSLGLQSSWCDGFEIYLHLRLLLTGITTSPFLFRQCCLSHQLFHAVHNHPTIQQIFIHLLGPFYRVIHRNLFYLF